jgi:glycosyltransferase involved in cell wall biosynthesis
MSHVPQVSVIIPCYNQGRYLDDAITSVLVQTYQNFEILIVDDGSTEPETIEILQDYQQPKTRIIRTENQGVATARNLGIAQAQGTYILPLDADDKIADSYLEKAVTLLEGNEQLGALRYPLC